ncbi:MAG: response regulator [Methylocella sp.]|jgi:CheY-like chemotaxis protein
MTSPLSGRRVLVVEDETMVAWLLKDMLADLGCAVVGPATHVNQALAMLDAETIDAAVLDINLNGQKSYPVADALAARGVPFVFSTGYNKDSLPNSYQSFPVLQKPFDRLKLGDTLAKLLTPKEPGV